MIWPLLVLSISLVSSIDAQKLHEHLTKEEIQSVFHCNHDVVHELDYQVVTIFHKNNDADSKKVRSRSNPVVRLQAFNQNYTLYLEENDNVLLGEGTPLFLAKGSVRGKRLSGKSSIQYTEVKYPLPADFKLYHDMQSRAALTVHKDSDDKVHVDGIVGDNLVIRPLPARVHEEVIPRAMMFMQMNNPFGSDPFDDIPFMDDGDEDDIFSRNPFSGSFQQTHHVVIRPTEDPMNPFFNPIGNNKWLQQPNHIFGNHHDNPYANWQQYVHQHWSPPVRPPFSWHPSTRDPFASWPTKPPMHWRPPTTKEPLNWPVPTRPPMHWRPPTTKDPENWPVPTRPPMHWRPPTTKDPENWPVPTRPPMHWRPSTTKKPENWPAPTVPTRPPMAPHTTKNPQHPVARADTVYPQLLVTCDYETYTTHGKDVEAVSKYMAAFWNAVDLRFREINHPNIRLNIAGLIIPQDSNAVSYMDKHLVGEKTIEADKTLREVGQYFANEKKFSETEYDVAVAVSHRNLGATMKGKFSDGVTGIATFEGACLTKEGHAAALVRDKGGFNGITTAAHELAHALGAPHDGDESASVPGGPCSWNDGYLMSYERKDYKGMHWSQCSITAMRQFFKTETAQCLKNKPDAGNAYPKILPGKLLSRDEQCKRSMGMVSYKEEESNCAVLWCATYTKTQVSYGTENRPPAEGSYCGEKAICLNAKCVKDPEAEN